ncbi:MAG: hypothetical protein SFY32_10670 [Bacteroidota bacterium]|nr:hypothetical protein [Bacteroidota bacterium]
MKTNKILFTSIILCIALQAFTQKKDVNSNTQTTNTNNSTTYTDQDKLFVLNEKILKDALKFGDLNVAKQALYEMIALKPEKKSLRDSLAYVYINLGQLQQAILLSREILETDANNNGILEVKAIAEQNLGLSKEALASYETLYGKTKSIFHLYQIATLQYDLKRVAECSASVDQLINSPDASDKEINIGTGNRNQQQRVKLKAAALNVKGVLAMDVNELKVAQFCFTEALKLTQDFVLAQNNLTLVNQKLNPPAATKSATPTSNKKK